MFSNREKRFLAPTQLDPTGWTLILMQHTRFMEELYGKQRVNLKYDVIHAKNYFNSYINKYLQLRNVKTYSAS
jgi:hypothetical protein